MQHFGDFSTTSNGIHIPDGDDFSDIPLVGDRNANPLLKITPEDLRLPDTLRQQLPDTVRQYLGYASPLSDVPDEFLLTPFLAVTGALIGKKRFIELGGITIYPVIWTVLFAGSSTLRKSTGLSLAKKPFKGIQEAWIQEYERDLIHWQEEKDFAEQQKQPFNDPEPIRKTLYCSDGFSDLTFWETLGDNGSLVSTPSEFTSLWNELNRPRNSMKDLSLSIFDAEDSIRRNTKNAGDIELNNPVWCIAGATTLTNFQQSLSAVERSSGLLQRILPVCMEERTKPFKSLTELPSPDTELYHSIDNKLQTLMDLPPKPVDISPEARAIYTDWSHRLKERAEQLSDSIDDIGGYESRLSVYGLKFALIFQQLDQPGLTISKQNMEASITLCEWLFKHILYMLDRNYIFNRYYADRLKIRELLEKKGGTMTRTDLMNYSNFDKEQLDKALSNDVEAGIIEEIQIETGGRPRYDYRLKKAT